MTGSRSGDFKSANTEAGRSHFGNEAPEDYVWHHMDDFEVDANGDAWCTMQLVQENVHSKTPGMAHNGSVAQYKKYYINISNTPNNKFY